MRIPYLKSDTSITYSASGNT